jgi:cytochrome c
MKRQITIAAILSLLTAGALADDYAKPQDAEQMVAKAVAAIRKDGPSVYASINAKDPLWVRGDLYPVVYDLHGKVLAHGQNQKMIGKDLIDMRDADGKSFVRERVDMAKQKGTFWQDYSFLDPVTKSILPKRMYCERLDETVVCAGIYKR